MEAIQIIEKIEENLHVFEALLSPVSVVESAWKPDQSKWSLTEIVCHLVDEEVEDFRARIKHCLQGNEGLPPAIDPVGWVSSRSYTDQDYNKKILEFIKERSTSIQWLRSFIDPDWDSSFEDHHFGRILEKKLNEDKGDQGYEVLNFGVGNYDYSDLVVQYKKSQHYHLAKIQQENLIHLRVLFQEH